MTIGITIIGYNRHTAGPRREYRFHVDRLTTVTGQENQFEHGYRQARSILLGLEAVDPLSDFTIQAVDIAANGGGTQIDGVDLSAVAKMMRERPAADNLEDF